MHIFSKKKILSTILSLYEHSTISLFNIITYKYLTKHEMSRFSDESSNMIFLDSVSRNQFTNQARGIVI